MSKNITFPFEPTIKHRSIASHFLKACMEAKMSSFKELEQRAIELYGETGCIRQASLTNYVNGIRSIPQNPKSVKKLYHIFQVHELTGKSLGWFQLLCDYPDCDPDTNPEIKDFFDTKIEPHPNLQEDILMLLDLANQVQNIETQISQLGRNILNYV